jgi:predicted nuclease with TOPRIM domain
MFWPFEKSAKQAEHERLTEQIKKQREDEKRLNEMQDKVNEALGKLLSHQGD